MIDHAIRTAHLTDEQRARYADLLPKMLPWFEQYRHLPNGSKLFWLVEERWGDELAREVCEPLEWHDMECVIGAIVLLREATEIHA